MMNHSTCFNFRMDADTRAELQSLSHKSGQPVSAVLRMLIHGTPIREMPPIDYHRMNRELYRIGHNLNQLAKIANATGQPNHEVYTLVANQLRKAILDIETAVFQR